MSPALVLDLALRGVALRAEEDRLRWTAPPGALTPEDLEQLRLHRDELVSFLHRAQGDEGQAARSQARAEITREAVRLVNGRELPLAERPEWDMPEGAQGWPLWILGQGAWVRDSLWPVKGVNVEEMGHPNRLPESPSCPWPPASCPPSEATWAAHHEQCFLAELDAARSRAGLRLHHEGDTP